IVSVSANSRNMRPTRPVMNRSGMNTAISETVSEMTVKPISRAPRSAACIGVSPSSMWRTMFSIITIASSTTKPVPMVSAISARGNGGLKARKFLPYQFDGLDDVRARLALHVDDHGGRALVPAGDLAVLQAVDHVGHVLEQNRGPRAISDDDGLVRLGGAELI